MVTGITFVKYQTVQVQKFCTERGLPPGGGTPRHSPLPVAWRRFTVSPV